MEKDKKILSIFLLLIVLIFGGYILTYLLKNKGIIQPTVKPTPTTQETIEPTAKPTIEPTTEPTTEPRYNQFDLPFGFLGPMLQKPDADWKDYIYLINDLKVYSIRNGGLDAFLRVQERKPYNWQQHDEFVKLAQGKGIMPYPFFHITSVTSAASLNNYINFVKSAVERYDGDGMNDMPNLKYGLRYWMTQAEPDHPNKRYWKDTPENYALLVEATIKAVNEVCQGCQIVIGGSYGDVNSYKQNGFYYKVFDKLNQISTVAKNNKAKLIVDFHYFGHIGEYKKYKEFIEAINSLTENFGYGELPVWITETSTYSGTILGVSQTEKEQASEIVRRHIFAISNGIKKIFHDGPLSNTESKNFFGYVGLRDINNKPKLSYFSYKLMIDKLKNSDWADIQTLFNGENNVYGYRFTDIENNKFVYLVWWDYFQDPEYSAAKTKKITLNIEKNQIKVINFVPPADKGTSFNENNYPNLFDIKTLESVSGEFLLSLQEEPILIE